MPEVIIAIITGAFSVVTVIITSFASSRKLQQQLEISQAVTNTKLENLTSEVRAHNGFANRIPVIEEKYNAMEKQIEKLEKIISELEHKP